MGLKRAKTINGLKDAKETIIIKPENGTPGHKDQYPDSFYGWSAFIWAQEFHKINGRWWIVAGFHKGASSTNGGWCNNTILIPYTGDEQSIKDGGFLKAENWGEPTVLEGAAFDVTYFEREENGKTQGYWLFPKSAGLYLAKAKMGDNGEVPLVDGSLKQIYQVSQQFEYGKQAPTPGDNTEGSDQAIVEAPFMFKHGGYVYIAYAGATVDKYYNTNVMRAKADADLTDPASWTTAAFPSLDTLDTYTGKYGADETSYERRHAGPGHISLAHDEAGNIVMAYHARPYPEIHSGSAAGGLFDQDRNTWLKAVNVRANGMLDMSLTKDQEVAPANRTVTVKVVVAPESGEQASSDATLKSLEVAGVGVDLAKAASADGASLEVADPGSVKVADVAAVVADANAKAVVKVADGKVTVVVTAQDGKTTKTYTVRLVKKSEPVEPSKPTPGPSDKPGTGAGGGTGAGSGSGNASAGAGAAGANGAAADANGGDKAAGSRSGSLSRTGAAVGGIALAVVALAGAGIALALRRRRA
ncbi:family 43 glycosylhydrolase [Bifidobacterium pluvialisilvae]|uniref:family 43 glycosylhydrolase n=1 Tax=Bifidobacterium pluvialisilvae TaxID=2834436 RepID=UPI0027E36FDE|nr:family 43 glycosylhydrolase [Bifidobacterium pluvialisilvae]